MPIRIRYATLAAIWWAIMLASSLSPLFAATLLPPGEITFLDADGNPLAGGEVYFYVPNTTTPKDTWQDADQATLNTNPVVLDSAGRAIIYGSGTYRQIVKDSLGNTIWDQETADTASSTSTAWGGTSGGTANVQTVVAATYVGTNGQLLEFISGFTNTASTTVNVNGSGAVTVYKETPSGPATLTGGEIVAGNLILLGYDGFQFQLLSSTPSGSGVIGPQTDLASATTTELCSIPSHNVNITGTTTITSLGSTGCSTDFPSYNVIFAGTLTLTYNATSLIMPTAASITTAAGDTAVMEYEGSGHWRVRDYMRANGLALRLAAGTNGATGSIPYYASAGTPALLPIGTEGYVARVQSGIPAWTQFTTINFQDFTSSGTWTKPSTVTSGSLTLARCWGAGGGGGSGGNSRVGGGGGGGFDDAWLLTSSLGATETVTVGTGGAVNTAGGNSSFGSWVTAKGGGAGAAGTSSGPGAGGGGGSALNAGGNASTSIAGTGGNGFPDNGTNIFNGSSGGSSANGSTAYRGGSGGGGYSGSTAYNGGTAYWGAAGGGGYFEGGGGATGTGGSSRYGGAGGDGNVVGHVPGGGGGGGQAGANGECRVWTIN